MHIIDRYAYANKIRRIDPAHKAGLALAVLFLCLLLNEPAVSLIAIAWMWGLAVRLAGLSTFIFGRVLLAELLFLTLATVGVALSFSTSQPLHPDLWTAHLGPISISTGPAALFLAANLILRALAAASAMNFLALTTPLVDIVQLLRRWHVPLILIDLMTLIYRFIFVLLETLNAMYIAQESRLGYHTSYKRGMNNAALLASRLFIDAYQRSHRLQIALESRGFEGDLRVLPTSYSPDRKVLWAAVAVIASLVLTWIVL